MGRIAVQKAKQTGLAGIILLALAIALLAIGSNVAASPSAPAYPSFAPGCGPDWTVVTGPNTSTGNLSGIAAVSSTDVWAVGYSGPSTGGQTLTEHWNGNTWSLVQSQNPGTSSQLYAVAAVSSSDVWAVGFFDSGSVLQTLIEHWDGGAWHIVPSPNVGTNSNQLNGVAAVSTNDVWAVGTFNSPIFHTLTEHWDGSAWSVVSSPNPDTYNNLFAETAISSNDVWAVGGHRSASAFRTLIEHWDGSGWSVVPDSTTGTNVLNGVTAVSSSDVWAVGSSGVSPDHTLVEHWDGSAWNVVQSQNPSATDNQLKAVAAVSSSDVWAVGYYNDSSAFRTLVQHWDGSTWSVVPSPDVPKHDTLLGVTIASSSDVWAVGYVLTDSAFHGLIERYNPCTGSPTATPAPSDTPNVTATATGTTAPPTSTDTLSPTQTPAQTNTPAPPTSTGAPTNTATGTPTSTPMPCPISFSDVHPSDYFYQAVIYLACHGAISGYADGSFRPFNNTTRGQIAKIVIVGFGIPIDTSGGPHFSDVPTDHTFYAYVETANHNGIISGYSDGTFRPQNNVTRGQLSKIVTQAAILVNHWTLINPPTPTFTDVPPGSAFYQYVETAVSHGVISGYADHTFRPGNDATRGQIAKITYLAVGTLKR